MVVIRLARGGTNKRPFYHVVVADKRYSRNGRHLEQVGLFNPVANGPEIYLRINKERVSYWLERGAQPSDRVKDLMKEFDQIGEKTGAEVAANPTAKTIKKTKAKEAKKAKAAAENAPSSESSTEIAQ